MEAIWTDGKICDDFRAEFSELAGRTDGTIEVDTDTTVFCAFEPTSHRPAMRVGVYYASGRNTFRFDTVREELELAMVDRYRIDRAQLLIQSEKGSRTFNLDVAGGNWTVSKESV